MGKREREEGKERKEDGGGGGKHGKERDPKIVKTGGSSIGDRTSHIKNKQRRGEVLSGLKAEKKVRKELRTP